MYSLAIGILFWYCEYRPRIVAWYSIGDSPCGAINLIVVETATAIGKMETALHALAGEAGRWQECLAKEFDR